MISETIVSLQDVVEEDQQLEQTANAVLGDSDDTQCTYPKVIDFNMISHTDINITVTLNCCISCFMLAVTIS